MMHPKTRPVGGVIDRYRERLPVTAETPVVTLLEGGTRLVRVPRFVDAIGGEFDLYLKLGAQPDRSFKDRGMTLAVSQAKERGAQVVVCASTGNTSAPPPRRARRLEVRGAHPRATSPRGNWRRA